MALIMVINFYQKLGGKTNVMVQELVDEADPQVRGEGKTALALRPNSMHYVQNVQTPQENKGQQPEHSATKPIADSVRLRNGRNPGEEFAYKEYVMQLALAKLAQAQSQVAAQTLDPMKNVPLDAVISFKDAKKTEKKDDQRSSAQLRDNDDTHSSESESPIVKFQTTLPRQASATLLEFRLAS